MIAGMIIKSSYSSFLKPLLLVFVMSVVFILVIGKVDIDRHQENLYLGEPYITLKGGDVFLNHRDPFEENGWHAVLPPAFILISTGSFGIMRAYLFLFSILTMLLMYQLCLRYGKSSESWNSGHKWMVLLICAVMWLSIPLMLQYPFQSNGMMFGFVFVLLGMLVYERHPMSAMFLFGCAAATKGQFLTYLPGIILYQFFIRRADRPWLKRIILTTGDILLFLLPHFILAVLAMTLGWFRTVEEFIHYFFMQVSLVSSFFGKAVRQLFAGNGLENISFFASLKDRYWKYEFKTYGLLSWIQIFFSVSACLFFSCQAVYQLMKRRSGSLLDGFMGFALLPFWVNFLLFWAYPYWYNVLAVMPFNIYFLVRLLGKTEHLLETRMTVSMSRFAHVVLAFFLIVVAINRISYLRLFDSARRGNAFELYAWMDR
jgi:hypothetical protein